MFVAWGIHDRALVERIGDYTFKLKFMKGDKKRRVFEGGPWRHKGDALIIVHYDGLAEPSEVKIENIGI
jgi:hypothetical protein